MNFGGLAFHPQKPVLATHGAEDQVIRVWFLECNAILKTNESLQTTRYYKNAKVVLAGDTERGKSGLALVLTGQDWQATESTHGRHVKHFDIHEIELPGGRQVSYHKPCEKKYIQTVISHFSYQYFGQFFEDPHIKGCFGNEWSDFPKSEHALCFGNFEDSFPKQLKNCPKYCFYLCA